MSFARYQREPLHAFIRRAQLNPQDSDAHFRLGLKYADCNRFNDAEDSLRTALKLRPEDSKALHFLGRALSDQGKNQEALAFFKSAEKSFALSPRHEREVYLPLNYRHMGDAYTKLMDKEAAVAAYHECIKINEWGPEAKYARQQIEKLSVSDTKVNRDFIAEPHSRETSAALTPFVLPRLPIHRSPEQVVARRLDPMPMEDDIIAIHASHSTRTIELNLQAGKPMTWFEAHSLEGDLWFNNLGPYKGLSHDQKWALLMQRDQEIDQHFGFGRNSDGSLTQGYRRLVESGTHGLVPIPKNSPPWTPEAQPSSINLVVTQSNSSVTIWTRLSAVAKSIRSMLQSNE